MKIIAFTASPRKNSNSAALVTHFLQGASETNAHVDLFNTNNLNLKNCRGCLRCNLIKKCSLKNDDWPGIAEKILASDIIAFATPIYFHHLPASLKKIIDRFRSFVNVQITESGLKHTPWHIWNKDFYLFLTMGSSSPSEAQSVIDLFEYITEILGNRNRLHIVSATRLAVSGQINMKQQELQTLYKKLGLSEKLAESDVQQNHSLLEKCYYAGGNIKGLNHDGSVKSPKNSLYLKS